MKEMSRRKRRMEAASEGGQGPEGGCSTTDGWGLYLKRLSHRFNMTSLQKYACQICGF